MMTEFMTCNFLYFTHEQVETTIETNGYVQTTPNYCVDYKI